MPDSCITAPDGSDASDSLPKRERPIRVLQVLNSLNRGGIETWLLNVQRHVSTSEAQLDFFLHETGSAYEQEAKRMGARIFIGGSPKHLLRYVGRLYRVLREGKYDVVHSHLYLFSGLVLLISKLAGVPVRIAHMHPHEDAKRSSPLRAAFRISMARCLRFVATDFFAPSEASLMSTIRLCRPSETTSTRVVYNGIDLAQFSNIASPPPQATDSNTRFTICYVARFAWNKNHAMLFRVADLAEARGYPFRFVIAGSHGPSSEFVRRQSSLRQNVDLREGLADITSVLSQSDMFFFPSTNEGFGIVALEACAASLPVAATSLVTIKEALPESHHDLMFSPDDDERALQSLATVYENVHLRTSLKKDALAWAAKFSIDRSVQRLMGFYLESTHSRQHNAGKQLSRC